MYTQKKQLATSLIAFTVLLAMTLTGCSSGTKVTRIESSVATDLSGRWNDTDSRLVAEAMASGSEAVTEDQFVAILRSPLPLVIAAIGFAGLLVLLWLMMFKPF